MLVVSSSSSQTKLAIAGKPIILILSFNLHLGPFLRRSGECGERQWLDLGDENLPGLDEVVHDVPCGIDMMGLGNLPQ